MQIPQHEWDRLAEESRRWLIEMLEASPRRDRGAKQSEDVESGDVQRREPESGTSRLVRQDEEEV